jgi:hypothetical protein
MNTDLKNAWRPLGRALLAIASLLAASGVATAQAQAEAAAPPGKGFKDERALAVLRGMSDTLAGAKTLSFRIRGIVPMPAPTGQFVSLFASSHVVMQRPDKLYVAARGDLFPSDIYYDGKTVTVVGAQDKFYARRDSEGGAIEAVMQGLSPGSDATMPFLDLLVRDPYSYLTKDFSSALWVGQSVVGGVRTDHLAFTSEGLDWEIWTGAADKLPRLMVVSYRTGERQPTFTVEFSEWKLGAPVAAQTFKARIPKDSVQLEFKQFGLAR